jgi:hypothetical protein
MSGLLQPLEMERTARLALRGAWVRWGSAAGLGTIAATGLLLIARRLSGAVTLNLPPLQLVMTAIIAALVILGGRVVWRQVDGGPSERERERVFGWSGSAAIVLLGIGCSLGGRLADWAVWLPLVAVDQWQLRWFFRAGGGDGAGLELGDAVAGGGTGDAIAGFMELQRVVRVREEDGTEAIQAMLRAEFVAGQRQATLHVAFCPPLERVPVIEVETVDGAEAELKVAQAYCHGARVEVRLTEPAEEDCAVAVELFARPQAAQETQAEMGRGSPRMKSS